MVHTEGRMKRPGRNKLRQRRLLLVLWIGLPLVLWAAPAAATSPEPRPAAQDVETESSDTFDGDDLGERRLHGKACAEAAPVSFPSSVSAARDSHVASAIGPRAPPSA